MGSTTAREEAILSAEGKQPDSPAIYIRAGCRNGIRPVSLPTASHCTVSIKTVVLPHDTLLEVPIRLNERPSTMEAGSSSTRRDEETLETLETLETQVEEDDVPPTTYAQSFTPRSLFVGLAIGALITFSNTYFGLQTGWISVMTMPSSLIGFAVFRSLSRHLSFPFTPVENVLIQTVAGAVGTMPLGCGFVGVIPALEYLLRPGPDGPMDGSDGGDGEGGPLKLASWKLIVWSLGVCLFGVIFAVPLRKEVIVREKLKFPSGTATALMINVLHGATKPVDKGKGTTRRLNHSVDSPAETERLLASNDIAGVTLEHLEADRRRKHEWKAKIRMLLLAFGVSAIYVSSF